MFPLLLARTCRRKNNRVVGGLSRRDASVILSETAYSQFGMDILIRSGIIYYR